MANFWEFLWSSFLIFAFIAYLMILFSIVTDLFRDRELNGWYKAIWVVFLILLPYLTAFVYLIARGRTMAERSHQYAAKAQEATDNYIRHAAGTGPASEIAHAKALLDGGTITAAEFESLKAKALTSA